MALGKISNYLEQKPTLTIPEAPKEQPTQLEDTIDTLTWRAYLMRVFNKPEESERRNNSAKIQTGELTTRPKGEPITNLNRLTTLALFQPDFKENEHQGGTFAYQRTLNYYLNNLMSTNSPPSSFMVFIKDPEEHLKQKKIIHKKGKLFCDNEELSPNFHEGRWRFSASFLEKCIGYKITDEVATHMGLKPCKNNMTLRKYIPIVTRGNPDITMLQYRGHNEYGSGANIPEDLLDPAIVFLGGCKSNRFVKKGQKSHFRSGIVALKHKTGWEINHHRARTILQALKDIKNQKKTITWEDLSTHLRTQTANGKDRFGESSMVLPGDNLEQKI